MPDHTTNESTNTIPYGYCHCGCGEKTSIATYNNKRDGAVKGHPRRYVQGHRHPYRTLAQAFWQHVKPGNQDACWEWQGYINSHGYGCLGHGKKHWIASRASYTIHHGIIPDGMNVCHKCDNPSCVNPHHLFLGTHADNALDKTRKGRHGNAILTPEKVRKIREMLGAGYTQRQVAKNFGVSFEVIRSVKQRKRWAHVP